MKIVYSIILLVTFNLFSNGQAIGEFQSIEPVSQDVLFHLPATHAFQVLTYSGTTLGDGKTMGVWNDFTGYVPINNSSENGYLCVNSEFVPGGVSIHDLQFNATTGLWEVTGSGAVDFSHFNCSVVSGGTVANCSGGITPWGTMITCEENDINFAVLCNVEGYPTFGWNIEIDPATREVKDQDNDGDPDKVWAMGLMKHENVTFAQDSITSYYGDDNETSGFVFKFIAANKANLSSGNLYVLKLDAGVTSGSWVQVPNTSQSDRGNTVSLSSNLGGTKFDRVEDVEIGTDGKIYFASTGQNKIFRFQDDGISVSAFEIYVDNIEYPVIHAGGTKMTLFSSPDNLAFDKEGNLWVTQDGGSNYMWVIRPNHSPSSPAVEVFGGTPKDCEPTGITFTPDGKFMFLSFQHPATSNNGSQTDVAGNTVVLNKDATLVLARKEFLGAQDTTSIGVADLKLEVLKVYPNPATDYIRIELTSDFFGEMNLNLFDASGKLMRSGRYEIHFGLNTVQLSVDDLSKGSYILEMRHKDKAFSHVFKN
ncbi:MAG: DUF839 domain-containing protein [Chitinophagales bacterium]|mgnify:CR=1 FL=1|nr:DUF839 domain-containing protein [Chitinophagales bacterium]